MSCDQGYCLSWVSCLVPNTMTGTVLLQQTFPKWVKTLHLTKKQAIHLFPCILSKLVSFLFTLGRAFPLLNGLVAREGVLFATQNK